ncbi:glyceraldehyde 3-phosphate dehydrogenase NAD-binding domain-containing protein [Terasakiella sp. A23]|uniref:type I glyceraldehyde-3-phosphate dehydrogenase n=1 Tax=Terasakiella sp. FCG-A23 TaxID=3080561 RepID=UPI002953CCC9|nr:glyceraldehyde 3-phosphate dehydrogenase NAD-binding domain-containing protein [Terasakiella sp. A23]MDV7341074.1 glyceraldehyde 3-phosphate dehydrogenase NAD-binding domain-containing protein [Terasakiella sp. A23]
MKKVAINGYGRIGQSVLRAIYEDASAYDFKVVAINSLDDIDAVAYQTRYDTTHGRFPKEVEVDGDCLVIDGDRIVVSNHADPKDLIWSGLYIDVLLECSGSFTDTATAKKFLDTGPQKILLSQPASADVDATIIYGLNQDSLKSDDIIVSAASCTSNCLIPILDIMERKWGIENGVSTTIHSAMNDQKMVDGSNPQNMRLSRSGAQSIIPIGTSLGKGIERFYPHLKDKFSCLHLRVPTINVSALDLSINLKTDVTVEEVNQVMKEEALGTFPGIVGFTEEMHASIDFNHDPHSVIVDGTQTQVSCGKTVKMLCWFDNEWGFANRMLDITQHMLSDALEHS